jgi:hypothetical protein
MLDEAARQDDLVIGLRPATRGTKGKSASRLVSVGAARLAKASSEGWRLRLRLNTREALMYALNHMMEHKATSLVFLDMTPDDRYLWLKTFVAKHYHN